MQEPLLPETVYHIYNHANGDENLFRSNENYHYFLRKYGEYIYPIAETFAYCLMPNHFHLMVKIRSEEEVLKFFKSKAGAKLPTGDLQGFQNLGGLAKEHLPNLLSKQFSDFFNSYAKAINKMFNRKGSLFIPNFKRKSVSDSQYFTHLIAYIHLNPVKHGFCSHILDWEHSSIHTYYLEKNTKLNRQYLIDYFGDKQALIDFHTNLKIDDKLFDL